jgi:hypothetical protein
MRVSVFIIFILACQPCFSQECFPVLKDKIQDYLDTSFTSKANYFQSIESNVYLATSSASRDRFFFDIPFDYKFESGSNACKSKIRVKLLDNFTEAYTRDYTPDQYRHIFWTNFTDLNNHLVLRIDLTSSQHESLFVDYSDESTVNYSEKKYKLYVYYISNDEPILIYGDKPADVSLKFIKYEN